MRTVKKLEATPVGAKIRLVFQLPGSTKYIEAVGEVKHLGQGGVGVEFVSIDSEGQHETEKFVKDFLKFEK